MTLLIAYSLFLMLSNMGFSVESYELAVAPSGESSTIAAQRTTKEITAIVSLDFDITVKRDGLQSAESDSEVAVQYLNEGQAKAPAMSFSCTDNNSCKTVICTGGPIYKILTEIEYFLAWCGNIYFDVIIENCMFYKNTIDRYTFSGNFKMSTLTIRNCQLDTIVDNAFMYQSVNILTNITFDGVQLKVLNAQTFNGLVAVKNFKLYNVLTQATSPLNANNFLQPMAASLSNLVLQQTEESDSFKTIYDPTGWLGVNSDIVYSKLLYVDLSDTNINNTLNGNTFAKLSAVEKLRLVNCSLSTIAENVFNGIVSTLKSLDLRYNRLQTLDAGFLATAVGKGINIEFGLNLWSCDCDKVEIIDYMKQVENSSAAEAVCATPTDLEGIQIRNAQMRCYDTTTVITTIITPAASSETTTIMRDTTAETTIETTETAPDAPPISSTTTTSASTTTRTTETSSKSSPTSSTTPMNSSTTSSTSATDTMPTIAYDTTEETTGSNIKTSPTPFTTVINNSTTDIITESSTLTIPFTTAINNPTTALDKTERTTISSTQTSTTLSTTPINNPCLPPLSPLTTTEDFTTEELTESSPKTSETPFTTPINNSTTDETTETNSKNSPTPSTSAINHPTTAVDKTEKTTTSSAKTSPTSPVTPVNNSTSTTSTPPITKMPTTADDTNEETTESGNIPITSTTTTIYSTTLSTSSSAASIHRWRW